MSELLKEAAEDLEEMEEQEERPSFVVDNDQKAEWCLEQRRRAIEEKEKWKEHYDKLLKAATETCESTIIRMEAMLRPYLQMQIDAGYAKVTKTEVNYRLPSGKLVFKRKEPEFKVDDKVLVPWLEKNDPDLVKVKKTADWAALKKKVAVVGDTVVTPEDAEVVPGVKVIPKEDEFTIGK